MFSYVAGHCYPYKLIHHMFSKAVQKGVQLHTNTPVNSIPSETDRDGLWALETPRGTIRAKKVIVATNAYTSALLPEYKDKIVPVRGICCHIDTPGKPPYLPNTYALRFSEDDFDYLIPRIDGSIIVGGARSAFLKDPAQWYGNADDSSLIEQARHYFDGYMQRHFQGWESSGAYVTDIWTGSKLGVILQARFQDLLR
jgi:glycine/D-amino acid oxidase-like deaminating enzyme